MGSVRNVGATGSRIRTVRFVPMTVELDEPVHLSFGKLDRRHIVMVEIETEGGVVGYGESWINWPPWAHLERVAAYEHFIGPLLIGRDAADRHGVRESLLDVLQPIGEQAAAMGPVIQALSGVDIALWDIAAKERGRSVRDLLGSEQASVPVYASSLFPESDVRADARRLRAQGFDAVKVRVGFDAGRERDLLGGLHLLRSEGFTIFADANRAWTLEEAERAGLRLVEYGVTLIEEPLRRFSVRDAERLYEATGLKVAIGENIYSLDEIEELAASPAVGAIQPDVTKNGGFSFLLAAGEIAVRSGVPVMPHCFGGPLGFLASCHALAGLGAVGSVEYPIPPHAPFWPLAGGPPAVTGGRVDVSGDVGFGFAVNLGRA